MKKRPNGAKDKKSFPKKGGIMKQASIKSKLQWGFLFVKPMLKPNIPVTVSEEDLVEAGKGADGMNTYYFFKEEMKDWIKILAPVLSFLAAWFLKKGEEK